MDVLYERCCGVDIHKKTISACVIVSGPGKPQKATRTFGTMTADLEELAEWLTSQGVTNVAMESTGVYWQPIVRHEAPFDRVRMKRASPVDCRSSPLKLGAA